MEKLIELLNEYNCNVLGLTDKRVLKESRDNPGTRFISLSSVGGWKIYLWIISKEYEFIKWLVDNDKINRTDLGKREMMLSCTKYENLLMRLAISDTPIEDLISYLR